MSSLRFSAKISPIWKREVKVPTSWDIPTKTTAPTTLPGSREPIPAMTAPVMRAKESERGKAPGATVPAVNARTTPANPAIPAEMTKAKTLERAELIPESSAAVELERTAFHVRPYLLLRIFCIPMQAMMAARVEIQNNHLKIRELFVLVFERKEKLKAKI